MSRSTQQFIIYALHEGSTDIGVDDQKDSLTSSDDQDESSVDYKSLYIKYKNKYKEEKKKSASYFQLVEELSQLLKNNSDVLTGVQKEVEKQKAEIDRLDSQYKITNSTLKRSWTSFTSFPESADEALSQKNARLQEQVHGFKKQLNLFYRKVQPRLLESDRMLNMIASSKTLVGSTELYEELSSLQKLVLNGLENVITKSNKLILDGAHLDDNVDLVLQMNLDSHSDDDNDDHYSSNIYVCK